jgi:hypothetical protein
MSRSTRNPRAAGRREPSQKLGIGGPVKCACPRSGRAWSARNVGPLVPKRGRTGESASPSGVRWVLASLHLSVTFAQPRRQQNLCRLPPEILEPVRRQFSIAERVLDIAVVKIRMQGARVMAGIGEGEAAGMAQHVRVRLEREPGRGAAERAHGRGAAYYHASMSLVDPHTFGPAPGDRVIERPRRAGELRQIWRWVRAHDWPAHVVLVLGAVAIASVVFVFGLLVGAGVAPVIGGG